MFTLVVCEEEEEGMGTMGLLRVANTSRAALNGLNICPIFFGFGFGLVGDLDSDSEGKEKSERGGGGGERGY